VCTYATRRGCAALLTVALGVAGTFAAGCSPGIRWRGYTFEHVYADSQRDQKLTLVYFRHWSVIACTDFEENVLKNPEVLEATKDLYCVPLDFRWDRPLADQWNIELPPGIVILAPDERVLASLYGEISLEQLLEAIQAAKSEFAPAPQPAEGP
jgi:hypothetical protein